MIYSPYGDRNSGGTRTNVDTEVHDVHDQEHRADGIGRDASGQNVNGQNVNGGDANGRDSNGRDGTATPVQRGSTADESVIGDVVDRDRDVVEAADGDADGGDRPEAVNADSADSTEAPDAVEAERADTPDAAAKADGVAAADTEASTGEDPNADVRTREATATDVDTPELAEVIAERTDVDADATDEGEPADADPTAAYQDPIAAGADVYAVDAEADRTAATDGAVDSHGPTDVPDGDVPVSAVDADYVAVGVAQPMTESEVAELAGADAGGFDVTRDTDGDAAPVDAAPVDAASAVDGMVLDPTVLDPTVLDRTAVGTMPGDAPVPDAPARMPSAYATHDRWQQIQLGFIDDPRGSVESARSLVVEAMEVRISALRDRQAAFDGWQSEATPDTEMLRAAIQGYRDLLNSLTDTP